jgi:hypothetical protein
VVSFHTPISLADIAKITRRLMPINQDDQDDAWDPSNPTDPLHHNRPKTNLAKSIYAHTEWCWVLLALASLTLQATRTVDVTPTHADIMYFGELGITFAFDVEIVIRFLATLPEWRSFWISGRNVLDLSLAVGCSVIQIPVIQRNEGVYEWFTILQLARFYRVILVIPRMKPLLVRFSEATFSKLSYSLWYSGRVFRVACGIRKPLRAREHVTLPHSHQLHLHARRSPTSPRRLSF